MEQIPPQQVEDDFLFWKQAVQLLFKRWHQEKGWNEIVIALHYQPWYLLQISLILIAEEKFILVVIIMNQMEIDIRLWHWCGGVALQHIPVALMRFLVEAIELIGQGEIQGK